MKTVNLTIPKQWNELTESQLRFVAKLFLSEWAQLRFKFLTHAMVRFAGITVMQTKPIRRNSKLKYLVKKKGQKFFLLTVNQLHAVASKLEWLLDVIQEVKPLKRIMFSRMSHPRLYNTQFIQFLTAENFYIAYSETKNKKHLACLVASVYHLPWQKFNENRVKQRSRKFMLCREHTLFTVFLW